MIYHRGAMWAQSVSILSNKRQLWPTASNEQLFWYPKKIDIRAVRFLAYGPHRTVYLQSLLISTYQPHF